MSQSAVTSSGDSEVAPELGTGVESARHLAAVADTDSAIVTHGLTKRFGKQVAVDGINLDVPRGSVYGFLGPNGSGKTTTIRVLLGLVLADEGVVSVLGGAMPHGARDVLPRVGSLVEGPAFHPYLSGYDNLARLDAADATVGRAGRRARIHSALERVGLDAAAKKKYRAYSLGMRQRLGLAAALIRPRDLLVLDEPTNGLDPQGTREVRHLVREVAREGTTVFVSSHLLHEVEQMCTHVGVMRSGRLVEEGTLSSLQETLVQRVRVETVKPALAAEVLAGIGLTGIKQDGDFVTAELGDDSSEPVINALVRASVPVLQAVVERPALEELFMSLTGEGFDVDE